MASGRPRPADAPPPASLPAWRGGRPRKTWRWLGIFSPALALCAGRVELAGLPQHFWAVSEPGRPLLGRTALGPGRARVGLVDGRAQLRDRGVEADLRLEPAGAPIAVRSRHGEQWIWTRKQPVRAVGAVWIDGRRALVDAPGLVDDSAGHHARATAWRWAAGAGTDIHGRRVTWNLVDGLHDAATGSERRVWLDGVPAETGPVEFLPGLAGVRFAEGGGLDFAARAVRERHERLLGGLVSSDYRQPFGTVAGELPGGIVLREGFGVMEDHRARW